MFPGGGVVYIPDHVVGDGAGTGCLVNTGVYLFNAIEEVGPHTGNHHHNYVEFGIGRGLGGSVM